MLKLERDQCDIFKCLVSSNASNRGWMLICEIWFRYSCFHLLVGSNRMKVFTYAVKYLNI